MVHRNVSWRRAAHALQLLCWTRLLMCTANEQKCQRDCLMPPRQGLCPWGRDLARRFVDPRAVDTTVDMVDELDKKAFNLQFKKIDFDYCQDPVNYTDVRGTYHARVRDSMRLPDPAENSTTSAGRLIRNNEWLKETWVPEKNKTEYLPGRDGFVVLNFTMFPSGTFPFYGQDYKEAALSSNGYVAFRENSTQKSGMQHDVFTLGQPRISVLFAPLLGDRSGTVRSRYFNESGGERLTITFREVGFEQNAASNSTFQLSLFATGRIRMAWEHVANESSTLVGIMTGKRSLSYKPIEFVDFNNCIRNPTCNSEEANTRLVGPTRPSDPNVYLFGLHKTIQLGLTRPHPYAVHPDPNPYTQFCAIGCTFYYTVAGWNTTDPDRTETLVPTYAPSSSPTRTTTSPTTSPTEYVEPTNTLQMCLDRCDYTYAYDITTGYNDAAEVARLECWDGCQMANLRCQAGFSCYLGMMTKCAPGTFRHDDYDNVEQCFSCPPGRYREEPGGRDINSCSKCKVGRYVNTTGSDNAADCLRCPAGRFSPEAGLARCKCIFDSTFPDECDDKQGYSPPNVATLSADETYDGIRIVPETFHDLREDRDSVPFTGRF